MCLTCFCPQFREYNLGIEPIAKQWPKSAVGIQKTDYYCIMALI